MVLINFLSFILSAATLSSATEWDVKGSILRTDPGVYGSVEEFHYFYNQWPYVWLDPAPSFLITTQNRTFRLGKRTHFYLLHQRRLLVYSWPGHESDD